MGRDAKEKKVQPTYHRLFTLVSYRYEQLPAQLTDRDLPGGPMTATNKIRIATADRSGALDLVCSEVESAVGMPVRPVFQEIEGDCLILELRLDDDAAQAPLPTRLALAVDTVARDVQVLSAWNEPEASEGVPRFDPDWPPELVTRSGDARQLPPCRSKDEPAMRYQGEKPFGTAPPAP
jgi:hypothetical protein